MVAMASESIGIIPRGPILQQQPQYACNSEQARQDLVRKIYTALVLNSYSLRLRDVAKLSEFDRLVGVMKQSGEWSGAREFVELHAHVFELSDDSNCSVIKPIVTIEFCRDFDGKKGCESPLCRKLHVCRHYVKGKCTFGPRCKKPHHFQNYETRNLLKMHYLDEATEEQIREFLCRNVQHFLEPDVSSQELPKSLEICKYYNVATGCTREGCPFLHVCRFYAEEGNCKFGNQCIRKHDIQDQHAREVLQRYHMDALNEEQVLAFLKIKADGRELQSQVLEKSNTPGLPNFQSLPGGLPTLPHPFSLPNTIFGALKLLQDAGQNGLKNGLPLPISTISNSMLPGSGGGGSPKLGMRNSSAPSMPGVAQPNGSGVGSKMFNGQPNSSNVNINMNVNVSSNTMSSVTNNSGVQLPPGKSSQPRFDAADTNGFSPMLTRHQIQQQKAAAASFGIAGGTQQRPSPPAERRNGSPELADLLLRKSSFGRQPDSNSSGRFDSDVLGGSFPSLLERLSLEKDSAMNHPPAPIGSESTGSRDSFLQSLSQGRQNDGSKFLSNLSPPQQQQRDSSPGGSPRQQHSRESSLSLDTAAPGGKSDSHESRDFLSSLFGSSAHAQFKNHVTGNGGSKSFDETLSELALRAASQTNRSSAETFASFQENGQSSPDAISNESFFSYPRRDSPPGLTKQPNSFASQGSVARGGSPPSRGGGSPASSDGSSGGGGGGGISIVGSPMSPRNKQPHASSFHGSGQWVPSESRSAQQAYVTADSGGGDDILSYFRTSSLPNVSNVSSAVTREDERTTAVARERCACEAGRAEICTFHLRGYCHLNQRCTRVHAKEAYQWQVYTQATSSLDPSNNSHKNENHSEQSSPGGGGAAGGGCWVDVDKTENLKLERSYCSVDVNGCEFELAGETVSVDFDEMTAVCTSAESVSVAARAPQCNLSSWLLQMRTDDSTSAEQQTYKIRRLSTPSSEKSFSDSVVSTNWKWFWLDSFGIWRSYLSRDSSSNTNSSNDQETTDSNSLYSVDIEKAYLKGHETYAMKYQGVVLDFGNMQHITYSSRKVKKIRRRPDFVTKEDMNLKFRREMNHVTSIADIRPWHWPREWNLTVDFDTVDLPDTSDIFQVVRRHFGRSMSRHELVAIKSVQNMKLWANFVRAKMMLTSSVGPTAERFVFRPTDESDVRAVCQQGFPLCTCARSSGGPEVTAPPEQNILHREACFAAGQCAPSAGGVRYMFCARVFTTAPPGEASTTSEQGSAQFGSTFGEMARAFKLSEPCVGVGGETRSVACRYPYQAYPEFLVLFKM